MQRIRRLAVAVLLGTATLPCAHAESFTPGAIRHRSLQSNVPFRPKIDAALRRLRVPAQPEVQALQAASAQREAGVLAGRPLKARQARPRGQQQNAGPLEDSWPNTIAICAVCNEPWSIVGEWLEYHRHIGVNRVFLRELSNDTQIQTQVQPYVASGFVDFGMIPAPAAGTWQEMRDAFDDVQHDWYTECAQMAQKEFSWVTFIDLDEYIIVLNRQQAVSEQGALTNVLRRSFRFTATVQMQWVMFGTSGHRQTPAAGTLRGFTRCTGQLAKQTKSMANTHALHPTTPFKPFGTHSVIVMPGSVVVLGDNEPMQLQKARIDGIPCRKYAGVMRDADAARRVNVTDDHQLVVFHYFMRSQQEYLEKKLQRAAGDITQSFSESTTAMQPGGDLYAHLATFERENGYDRAHAICEQGARLGEAIESQRH